MATPLATSADAIVKALSRVDGIASMARSLAEVEASYGNHVSAQLLEDVAESLSQLLAGECPLMLTASYFQREIEPGVTYDTAILAMPVRK